MLSLIDLIFVATLESKLSLPTSPMRFASLPTPLAKISASAVPVSLLVIPVCCSAFAIAPTNPVLTTSVMFSPIFPATDVTASNMLCANSFCFTCLFPPDVASVAATALVAALNICMFLIEFWTSGSK